MYSVRERLVWDGSKFVDKVEEPADVQEFAWAAAMCSGNMGGRHESARYRGEPFFREVAAGKISQEHKELFARLKSSDLENCRVSPYFHGQRSPFDKNTTVFTMK